jgi:hypothetical protein
MDPPSPSQRILEEMAKPLPAVIQQYPEEEAEVPQVKKEIDVELDGLKNDVQLAFRILVGAYMMYSPCLEVMTGINLPNIFTFRCKFLQIKLAQLHTLIEYILACMTSQDLLKNLPVIKIEDFSRVQLENLAATLKWDLLKSYSHTRWEEEWIKPDNKKLSNRWRNVKRMNKPGYARSPWSTLHTCKEIANYCFNGPEREQCLAEVSTMFDLPIVTIQQACSNEATTTNPIIQPFQGPFEEVDLRNTCADLQSKLSSITEEKNDIKAELDHTRANETEVKSKLKNCAKERDELRAVRDQLDTTNAELQETVLDLNQKLRERSQPVVEEAQLVRLLQGHSDRLEKIMSESNSKMKTWVEDRMDKNSGAIRKRSRSTESADQQHREPITSSSINRSSNSNSRSSSDSKGSSSKYARR